MKATSESSSNLGLPISMRDVLIRVWDQGYQSPHFRRSRFRPDGITFRITIACRQFPYSAAFTTNINWKKSRLEKFRMSYLRSTSLFSVRTHNIQRILPLRRKRKEDLWFARLSIRCSLPKNFLFGLRGRFTDGCPRCTRPEKKKS